MLKKLSSTRKKEPQEKNMNAILKLRDPFPLPPKHLKKTGKLKWSIGQELWSSGAISSVDIGNWVLFCEAWDEIDRCEAILKKHGEYQETKMGTFAAHPAIKRIEGLKKEIRRYSMAFGLYPQARRKAPALVQTKGVTTRPR